MVEIFGARGQDLTYPEMKWWTDHMQVSGVNFLIPHSFNPRAPYDTDCPPYFYNGGYRAALAAVSRLRRLHQPAEPDAHRRPARLPGGAAVYAAELPRSARFVTPGGHDHRPARRPTRLRLAAVRRVRATRSRVAGKELQLYRERYQVLIVPPVEVIPYATLAKVKEFFDAGGVVVGYGFLPSKSATLGHDVAGDRRAVRGRSGARTPTPGLSCCRTSRRRRPLVLPAGETHAAAVAAGSGRRRHSSRAGSPRRRDQRLAARAAPREGRARRLPGVQSEPPGRRAAVQVPRHGRAASRNAGTPCETKSRRSPSSASTTTPWSSRSTWSRWRPC